MKLSMAALAILAFASAANADPLARQYAAEILRQSAKVPEAELEFSEWQQSVSGGYILRFAFDVDGDGAAEQFLASSFNADRLICEWTVYGGASGKLLSKGISLRPDSFWWNPSTQAMLDYFPLGAEGGTAIFSRIENGKIVSRQQHARLEEVNVGLERREPPLPGFQRIKPSVTVCLLADVVSGDAASWRELIIEDGKGNYDLPNGRLLLTEDAPRVETLRSFTPTAALAALQKSDPQSEQPPSKSPTTNSLPIVQPPAPKKSPEAKPTVPAPSKEPTSSTPWSVIVVLIIAATGLLWLLVKNRK